MPGDGNKDKNTNQEENIQQNVLGGIPVPEEHVEYEPDPNETNYFAGANEQSEKQEDEELKLHEIDLNVPQFTDEQVKEAIDKDKKLEEEKQEKELHTLEDYDKFVYQQEQVLDMLNRKKQSLEDYSRTQNELLDARKKEISDYLLENRKSNKKKPEQNLPKDLDAYDKLSDQRIMKVRIDDVIAKEKKLHDQNTTMFEADKLNYDQLESYLGQNIQLNELANQINTDGLDKLSPKDKTWFVKNSGNPKLTSSTLSDYQQYYNQTQRAYKDYQDKNTDYLNATGITTRDQRKSQADDFEFYQTMVARQLMIKQTITKIAMGPEGVVKNFEALEKLGAQTNVREFNIMNASVKEKLSAAAAVDNSNLKELGYTFENAEKALDDYYELDRKIKEYRPVIEEQIRLDKAVNPATWGSADIIDTAKKREQWLKNHSSRYVDDYFRRDGSEKKNEEPGLKALSASYDPDKDQIAYRDKLKKETDQARFEYFKAAKAQQMLQKNAINKAIKKENERIDRENKLIEQEKAKEKKWKTQADCDQRFIEDAEKRASEAASKRRKMMLGSMVTRFATKLTGAVGDTAEKAGTIVAEGIVRGERVQVEGELKALNEKLDSKQTKATASLYIAQQNRNEARILNADDSKKKNKDLAFSKIVESGDHTMKAQTASASHISLEEEIKKKEEELVKAKEKEAAGIAAIEEKIGGAKQRDINKKLEQNKIDVYENNVSTLATELNNATKTIDSVKVGEDLTLSGDLIKDLASGNNDLRRQKLAVEEKDLINADKELKATMADLNRYGKKLGEYLTPDNMGKVDTIVGIAEMLYNAYSSVSGYLDSKEEEKQDEADANKVKETAEEYRKQAKDAKDDETKNELNEKAAALENAAKKYEKDDDPFELNIKDTIGDLKEKAKSINESLQGGGEEKETIIQNITDLTLEAGQIINFVSKKLDSIAAGMELSYEEALAREDSEKKFLSNVEVIKSSKQGSVVQTALNDIDEQKNTHIELMKKDLDDNAEAIKLQEKILNEAKASRKAYLDSIEKLAKREEEERKEALKKAEEKLADDNKKAETDTKDTEEIKAAREALKNAKIAEEDAGAAKDSAERDYRVKKGTNALAKADVEEKKHLQEVFKKEQERNEKQAKDIQNDSKYKDQFQKRDAFLALRQGEADKAKSTIRKTAVISFFVGVANSAAQNAKGFMDQLTIGAAESVVKGKAKQMEDELNDLENAFRLKGETALAKTRSSQEHIRNSSMLLPEVEKLKKEKEERDKKKKTNIKADSNYTEKFNIYDAEVKAADQDKLDAQKLHEERNKIAEDIKKKREELAKARAEEKVKLDALHKQLKEQYNVNPEEAEITIDIKTGLNQLKAETAKKAVEKYIEQKKDFIDILTSNAYIESDAAQRQVIKEQVKNLKQDKDVEAKAEKLDKYSDKLKGLFTPNNMSRVDTIVSAAETLVGLYGSVKGFITGSGGDDKEDEESKGIAGKIADMKEKAADIRKGMMEADGDAGKEQGVIDNILDIAGSMREITDTIAKKIDGMAKDYEETLDDQREIKAHADSEVKAYKEIFDKQPELPVDQAFAKKREADFKNIDENLKDSIALSEEALKNSVKPMEDAEKELKGKETALKDAGEKVNAARDELNRLVDIEVQKEKGKALHDFRETKREIEKERESWKDDYHDALNELFPMSEQEIRAEEQYKEAKKRAELEKAHLDKQNALIEENKKLLEEERKKSADRENELKNRLENTIDDQKQKLADQMAEIESQKAKLAEQLKLIEEQKAKLEQNQQQKQQEEQQRQEALDHEYAVAQQKKNENYKKLDKLDDILANLIETDKGYFGHSNSKKYEKMLKELDKFVGDREKNVDLTPEKTKDLKKALVEYLDHVGMGVAHHHNGNVRKENALAALDLIDHEKAHDYEVKASVKREGEKDRKKISLDTLMDRENVKRDPNKPKNRKVSDVIKEEKGANDLNNQKAKKK